MYKQSIIIQKIIIHKDHRRVPELFSKINKIYYYRVTNYLTILRNYMELYYSYNAGFLASGESECGRSRTIRKRER